MRSALVLAPLVAVLAAGCGSAAVSETPKPTSIAPIAASARKMATQATARESLTLEIKQGSETVKGGGGGSFDFGHHSGQLSLDMKSGDQSMHMDEVIAMPVIYMRSDVFHLPALDANGTQPWLKVDLQAAGKKLGIDFSSLMNASPDDTVASLGKYGTNVESLGEEDVRGVPATHYRATLDIAQLAAKDTGAAAESEKKIALLMDDTKVPFEIWIDDSGLTRRFSESFSETVPGSSDSIKVSMTSDMYDYGASVAITIPRASQVVDAAKVKSG
jgi:hypothetical protein